MRAIPWPDDRVAILRDLWTRNLTAKEIGRKMGISKNAVLGKVHRLGLEQRVAPIVKPAKLRGFQIPDQGFCCYIFGDPLKIGARYCGAPVHKRDWCKKHCDIVYHKPREPR